jgi:FKBP-type peptidyl-prolyl cis-trans isomerase
MMTRLPVVVMVLVLFGCATNAETNAQKEEAKVKITDEKVGEGPEAKKGDKLEVHYTGWLSDKTKFDSSKDRNKSFTITLGAGQVIKGWEQGLVGMKVGGIRKLVIPSELAYGPNGRPPVIPPNAELTFQVELLSIK